MDDGPTGQVVCGDDAGSVQGHDKAFARLRDKDTTLRNGLKDGRTQRPLVDAGSMDHTLLVVNAVKGDPAEGENGSPYATMGYVPKYAKRSGLTRKGQTTTPVAQNAVT